MALSFEGHEEKATASLRKHSVSFEEAKIVFNDPMTLTIEDREHTQEEPRYIDIGYSASRRLLVVVYTERGEAIRLISSRKATRTEQTYYERV